MLDLQCPRAIRVRWAIIKYKTDPDIKEVIRLYVYALCLILILTMTLHLHRGRWCPMPCTPSGIFVTTRKYLSPEQYVAC